MPKTNTSKNQNFWKKLLLFEVSFFTGSLILITAFVLAVSAMPGPEPKDESALEAILTTFVQNSDVKKAEIETENFRLQVYRNNYYKALDEKSEAEKEIISVELE